MCRGGALRKGRVSVDERGWTRSKITTDNVVDGQVVKSMENIVIIYKIDGSEPWSEG